MRMSPYDGVWCGVYVDAQKKDGGGNLLFPKKSNERHDCMYDAGGMLFF